MARANGSTSGRGTAPARSMVDTSVPLLEDVMRFPVRRESHRYAKHRSSDGQSRGGPGAPPHELPVRTTPVALALLCRLSLRRRPRGGRLRLCCCCGWCGGGFWRRLRLGRGLRHNVLLLLLLPHNLFLLRWRYRRQLRRNRIWPQLGGTIALRHQVDLLGGWLIAVERERGAQSCLFRLRNRESARRAAGLPIRELDLGAWWRRLKLHRLHQRLWLQTVEIEPTGIR